MSDKTEDDEGEWAVKVSSNHEPRWPASLAVLAALLLSVTLPEKLTIGPTWLLPTLGIALLAPLTLIAPMRHRKEEAWHRVAAIVLIGIVNLANVGSLILIVGTLLHGSKANGTQLIVEAMKIWLTNILVFALWYWEFDGGGPGHRDEPRHRPPDFVYPQMVTPEVAQKGWKPTFVDYLYLAFTNATAFSPTDTLPLTPWAKMLMLIQSLASLLTVGLVAARAVNILT